MILIYPDLMDLIKTKVIDAPTENVNGSSIDVTLGDKICIEKALTMPIDPLKSGQDSWWHIDLNDFSDSYKNVPVDSYILKPLETVLAHINETLNMDGNLSAEFKLKSSAGRSRINHNLAAWVDPYYKGRLTLELTNTSAINSVILTKGMKIGQLIFYKHDLVPWYVGYSKRGNYQGDMTVQPSRGIK